MPWIATEVFLTSEHTKIVPMSEKKVCVSQGLRETIFRAFDIPYQNNWH